MNSGLLNTENSLSIVIPVYNEAEVIADVIKDFYEKVVKKKPNTTLIVAEDGSTDGTKEILSELNTKIPFSLITGKERKGYTKAFKDALRLAETDLVLFSDSDSQHEPQDVFKLLDELDGYDIIGGYKQPRRDPIHRIVLSKTYNFLIYMLFGLKMKDIDAGFKLIKKAVINRILVDVTDMKHCVMSEFILKAYLSGYKIKEVPVTHYPRRGGKTAIFRPVKLPAIVLGLIESLLKIKFRYSKSQCK